MNDHKAHLANFVGIIGLMLMSVLQQLQIDEQRKAIRYLEMCERDRMNREFRQEQMQFGPVAKAVRE